jgi:uncharacterized protein YceH (UPF0502 family)
MLIDPLSPEEARVLGTLLEKSLATPDYYPMTLNALRTACNQKSSREPVTEYDEDTVALALAGLKRKTLVTFTPYGSQPDNYKYRHFLEDPRFKLDKPQLAVIAVLLLRGAQTLNEVRMRASSLHPIASPEEAEAVLKDLAARPEPLAELLAKRPGWKEPRWRDRLREHAEADAGSGGAEAPGEVTSMLPTQGRSKWEEFEEMKLRVADLEAEVAALRAVVEKIRSELY